jgi:hypothetical protein
MPLNYRASQSVPLTFEEMDENFFYLSESVSTLVPTTAATASYVLGSNVAGAVATATSATTAATSTTAATASYVLGSNVAGAVATATNATNATTAATASYVLGSNVAGAVATATNATNATNATTSSYIAGADVDGAVATATTANNLSAGTGEAVLPTSLPGTLETGSFYFDFSVPEFYIYDGSVWRTGSLV